MSTVYGYTAARMKAIEDSCIVNGGVLLDRLILTKRDGSTVDAGNVRGAKGDPGLGVVPVELGAGVDLNSYVTTGVWSQSSNSEAASGLNYPEAYAGLLQVHRNPSPEIQMVWQSYSLYGAQSTRMYKRSFYSTWSPWSKFIADGYNDTGWVKTGLTIGVATNWTLNSYALRKVGTRVSGQVTATYTGATTLTAGSDGNLGDQNAVIVLPTGWRNNSGAIMMITIWRQGYVSWIGRSNNDNSGEIDLVGASFPGQVITTGLSLTFQLNYYTD